MAETPGGGKVADVLLWKDIKVSAAVLSLGTLVWLLFEILEFNFVPFLCYISIVAMLGNFIWQKVKDKIPWNPSDAIGEVFGGFALRDLVSACSDGFNQFLDIASGNNLKSFVLAIISLYILALIGSYLSFLNLLFAGFVSMFTLPVLYEQFKGDIDDFIGPAFSEVKRMFGKLKNDILSKVPRAKQN